MEKKELLEFLNQIKTSNQELMDKMDKIEALVKANEQQNPRKDNNQEIVRKGMKFKSGLILPDIGMSHNTRTLLNESKRIIEVSKRKHRCWFF